MKIPNGLDVPIPEELRWKGPPNTVVTRTIIILTYSDCNGKLFYRVGPDQPWKRLWGIDAYIELNTIINKL